MVAPIRAAILNQRDNIIKAQVGAEANTHKIKTLEKDTIYYCNLVESNAWWDKLQKSVIPDLEHICCLTNIAQSNHVRPDQFLLALGGLFLHFHQKSAEHSLGQHMCKHVKKCCKELDQVVFVLTLVLNPSEKLSRFGDKAQIDVLKISTELITLFKRMNSRPTKNALTAKQQAKFDTEQKDTVQKSYDELHGDNLIGFWEMLKMRKDVISFVNFALQLLHLVVNQARLEHWFSDFLNKKNKKRNRLGLAKMAQQAKKLLSVPRDTDNSDNEGGKTSVVVQTSSAWRKQVAEWQAEMRELDMVFTCEGVADKDKDLPSSIPLPPLNSVSTCHCAPCSWFPTTLASLFGGVVENLFTLACRERVVSEESLYMELLAAEHSDEEPDVGAQEGSGDDYEG
ncbi:hypothetical protein DFH08DRAFT_828403 [Mycena albidolilacea]|uniref:Uncharacterized protein n=1 Tax=Mycena albidolilacea TaxID=1033008 RepID=A0AAD6YWQ2_9AGAR|nr:hypothetical protein DFH08DRAFT_828403 [Mycena albidolilacea]